jgi:hypothetical protein
MSDRAAAVTLSASSGEVTEGEGVFTEFALRQRLKRSGAVFLVAMGLAVLFLPIPIIHLLAIPMILIGGLAVAVRQLSITGRLASMRIACPRCGVQNRVGGGLGVRTLAPAEHACESCRRTLTLRLTLSP